MVIFNSYVSYVKLPEVASWVLPNVLSNRSSKHSTQPAPHTLQSKYPITVSYLVDHPN